MPAEDNKVPEKTKKRKSRLFLFAVDFTLTAALLLTFAYFHHVKPQKLGPGTVVDPGGEVDDQGTPDFKDPSVIILEKNDAGIGETLIVKISFRTEEDVSQSVITVSYNSSKLEYSGIEENTPGVSAVLQSPGTITVTAESDEGSFVLSGTLCTLGFKVIDGISGNEQTVELSEEGTSVTKSDGDEAEFTISNSTAQEKANAVFTVDAPSSKKGEQYTVILNFLSDLKITSGKISVIYNNVRLTKFWHTYGSGIQTEDISVTETDNGNNTSTLTFDFSSKDGSSAIENGRAIVLLFTANVDLEGLTPISVKVKSSDFTSEDGNVVCGIAKAEISEVKGDFRDIYPDKFSSSGIEIDTDTEFKSENSYITWYKVHDTDTWGKTVDYYVADIYLRTPDYLKSYVYTKSTGEMSATKVGTMAATTNALLAINGDYCSYRKGGIIVRNGIIYRNSPALDLDLLFMYGNGIMETYSAAQANTMNIEGLDLLNVWYFGPSLYREDGEPRTEWGNYKILPNNPRSGIGYYAPGHYCFVCVDGRAESEGLRMEEFASLFKSLDCTLAYNLDGGQSSAMTWDQQIINVPCNSAGDGRSISDIIYIPKE